MGKHLVLGAASNYSWKELQYWVNSLQKTGYTGDIAIAATNITKETIEKLVSCGVLLYLYGEKTDSGIFSSSKLAPHVERFFHLWSLLEKFDKDGQTYQNITVTDTRDVIFQTTPENILEEYPLITVGEGLKYNDEPWGKINYHNTFGPILYEKMKDNEILNVGIISGQYEYVKNLLLSIFQISINRPISVVDQAVYNFILYSPPYQDSSKQLEIGINLGTTIWALSAGSGDIGQKYLKDNDFLGEYNKNYLYKQPTISNDGVVLNNNGLPYTIVHQYDRVPFLKEKIEIMFGDK